MTPDDDTIGAAVDVLAVPSLETVVLGGADAGLAGLVDLSNTTDWLNQNSGAATFYANLAIAAVTLAYVLLTWLLLRSQRAEMRRQREPLLVIDVVGVPSDGTISVKNIGLGPALGVTVAHGKEHPFGKGPKVDLPPSIATGHLAIPGGESVRLPMQGEAVIFGDNGSGWGLELDVRYTDVSRRVDGFTRRTLAYMYEDHAPAPPVDSPLYDIEPPVETRSRRRWWNRR